MADNYVSLRIKATDDAKPDLDGLKAKLDELSHKVATARAQVDDKEADAALTALDVKLRRIAGKVVDPKIKVPGAERALAELLAVDVAMDRLKLKTDRMRLEADAEGAAGGLLTRMFLGARGRFSFENFLSNAFGGLKNMLQKIPFVPGEGGADAGGSGGLAGMGVAISLLVDGLGAAATELTGLVSGFAAAGAGAGAFYLLAHPAISNLEQDYKKLSSAQQAYQLAQEKAALDPTKANLKAEATALLNLRAVRKGMTADEGSAAAGISRLSAAYHKLSTAFRPEAFKVFSDVLKIANNILPQVTPFAKTFADSFDGLLKTVDKVTAIPQRIANTRLGSHLLVDPSALRPPPTAWEKFLGQLHSMEGPSIQAIGTGIGHIVTNLGKLLTMMSVKDVVNSINIAFSVLDGTLIGVIGFVRGTMWVWDRLTTAWDWMERVARRTGHDIAASWDFVRHKAAELGHDVAVWFGRIRHDIARWADDAGHAVNRVANWFAGLPGRIIGALASLPGRLYQAGQHAISMLISGLKSIPVVGTIVSIGQEIWDHLPHSPAKKGPLSGSGSPDIAGRRIAQMLAQGLTSGVPDVGRAMGRVAGAAGHYGAYGGGRGGGGYEITLRMGPGSLLKAMQAEVRAVGGDPAMFQKKVAYR